MYLPNLYTMSRMWHKVNFWEEHVFTQPLQHEQDVTQGQFMREYVFSQPLHHEQDVTQGQFMRGACIYPTPPPWVGCDTRSIFDGSIIYPTPPPWAGCDTRSIFERSMYLPNPSTINNKSRNIKITKVWWFYRSFKILILRFLVFPLFCSKPASFLFLLYFLGGVVCLLYRTSDLHVYNFDSICVLLGLWRLK